MRTRLLVLSLLITASQGWAADLALTYEQALQQDPKLKQALAQRDAQQQQRPIALAPLLPQVNVLGESSTLSPAYVNNTGDSIDTSTAVQKEHGYTFSATQALFNPNLWYTLGSAQQIYDAAESAYVAAQQELILRVAQAYFDVLQAKDDLSFTQAEKRAFEQQLKQTEDKFSVGLVAITDLHDFRAKFDEAVARELAAENRLDDMKARLEEITYQRFEELTPLRPELPLNKPEPADMNEWITFAQDHNPKLIAARYNMKAKKYSVDAAKSNHLPTVTVSTDFSGTTSGTVINPGDQNDTGWSILFQGTMNLFAGGGIEATVRQSQYNYEDAYYAFEETQRQTQANAKIAYRGVLTSMAQVLAYNQSVISAKSSNEANVAAYEAGTKTSVDVLDSISQLYNQERNLARSRYEYILNMLKLKQAAGTLSKMDVDMVNSWLALAPTSTQPLEPITKIYPDKSI